jgi:hypothetical protein
MSAGIGVSRFTYSIPISDYIPVLKIDDFTRWQIDVPVLVGMQNRFQAPARQRTPEPPRLPLTG